MNNKHTSRPAAPRGPGKPLAPGLPYEENISQQHNAAQISQQILKALDFLYK